MDLHQLRTFVHVAELGNIRAAAQRLNVAQSALTRRLQLLEGDLGVALLHRHGRGVMPTVRGKVFLERARAILRDVVEAREEVRGEQLDLRGTVGIGLPADLARTVAQRLLERVGAELPDVTLRFSTGYGADLVDRLNGGSLDLAILCHAVEAPSRKVHRLVREPLSLIAAGKLLAGEQRAWSLSDLANLPLIMPSRRHYLTGVVEDALLRAGQAMRLVVEVDDLPLLMSLVARGDGVTVQPARALEHATEADQARLGVAPLYPAPERTLALAVPLDRVTTPAAGRVRDLVMAVARDVIAPARAVPARPALSLVVGGPASHSSEGANTWRR